MVGLLYKFKSLECMNILFSKYDNFEFDKCIICFIYSLGSYSKYVNDLIIK